MSGNFGNLVEPFGNKVGWLFDRIRSGTKRLLKRKRVFENTVDAFEGTDHVAAFVGEFSRADNNPGLAGRIDGRRGWPRPDDSTKPDFIQTLHSRAQAYGSQIVRSANKTVTKLHQDIIERGPNLKEAVERRSLQAIEVDLPNTEAMYGKALVDSSLDREAAKAALSSFMDENGLEEEVPNEPAAAWRFGILAAMALVVEAAINGFMLKDATDGGFRSAAIYGAIPAGLNLILGLAFGCACRYRFLKQPTKAAGWACTGLAVVVCLALAGAIGTWRALAQDQDLDKVEGLLSAFAAHPFAWADSLWAIFLFVFSVLTFAVAFVHGERMTGHRYPGFAAKWWTLRDKTNEFNQLVGEVTGATKAITDAASAEIQGFEREAKAHRSSHCESLNRLNRLQEAVVDQLSQLTTEANRLGFEYALKNRRIRGAVPLPPALLRPVTFDYSWGGCGADANDAGLVWHDKRVAETGTASLVAQTNMIKARTRCLARLRRLIEDAFGEAPSDLPGPPLPDIDGDIPLYYGSIEGEDKE